MLLGQPFHFTSACCFTHASSTQNTKLNLELKRIALLQLVLLFGFDLPSYAKANCTATKHHFLLLLRAASAELKQSSKP